MKELGAVRSDPPRLPDAARLLDRWPALLACWLVSAWALGDLTDHYASGRWYTLPIFIAAAVAVLLILRRDQLGSWLALAAGVAAGAAEHLNRPSVVESDVLQQIGLAIRILQSGRDPYTALPVELLGGPYLYPPGPLFLYAAARELVGDLVTVERIAGLLTIALLALTARWAGAGRAALVTTAYGTYLFGTFRSLDGDNNTTLALLFCGGAFLLMRGETDDRPGRWSFWASVPVLALGVLLKQLAWPVYAFIALHLWSSRRGRWHILATIAIVAAAIAPFAVDDPSIVLRLVVGVVGNKSTVYGMNLLGGLAIFQPQLARSLIPVTVAVEVVTALVVTLLALRTGTKDLPDAILRSLGVLFILMILSNWTSPAYYMLLSTLFCFVVAVIGTRKPSPKRGASLADLAWLARFVRRRPSAPS